MTIPTSIPSTGPWAVIHRNAISHNLSWLRQRLYHCSPGAPVRVWAVVKADAYGHGLTHTVPALQQADGLGVTTPDDVRRLRRQGWQKPILLLSASGVRAEEICDPSLGELHLVIDEPSQLDQLERLARLPESRRPTRLNTWLRYAGRLGNLGFDVTEYAPAFERLLALKTKGLVVEAGHLHHYAGAEDADALRAERNEFATVVGRLPGPFSTGNSAALCGSLPETLRQEGHWLRCGLLLYGASALPGTAGAQLGLRPAMSVHARLVAVRYLKAGQNVGYGDTFQTQRDTWVGTACIGYSHGVPRQLWEQGHALVGPSGRPVPYAGRVAMDCLSLDLGPNACEQVGDIVTLWGHAPNGAALPVETVAASCSTIAAELFTGLTSRLPLISA